MKLSTKMRAHNFQILFIAVVIIKIFFLCAFHSEYVTKFFLPFIEHFAVHGGDPWHYFWQQGTGIEFPYNPLMVYLLAFFVKLGKTASASPFLLRILIKIPILLADALLTYLMLNTTKNKSLETLFFLSLSPILVYASFMHTQLDIIPTALLFFSIYLLRLQKPLEAGAIFGAALATKLHVAAAGPLLVIYLWKNRSLKTALKFCAITGAVYGFFVAPFIWSTGFYRMVLTHPKQMMLFDVTAQLGELKLLAPLFALLVLYGRFFTYKKINFDLLDSFLAITFAIIVFFIIPAPAWYLWMLPFVALLFIRNYEQNKILVLLYLVFNWAYILFFVFFHMETGVVDLFFFSNPINLKIFHPKLAHIAFTILESTLFLVIYFVYKAGIKSNELYTRQQNLVIGISGDSGTGKSTLMNHFINIFGTKATLIEGDGDHRWERGDSHWQEFTHLNPKANFLHRQAEHILLLKNHQPAWRINYNHHSGKFDSPQKIIPTDFILLSGLHPFYLPKMRKLTDVKIYLDPQDSIKQHWKIIRDMRERGHSKERILEQMNRRESDIKKYISPQKDFADIIIHYFTTDSFEIGNPETSFALQLKTTFDSSITIEPLLQALIQNSIKFEWNYANDLRSQELILEHPLASEILKQLHSNLLPNSDEIFSNSIDHLDGFDGFVQFICLMVISEKMKERHAS